MNSPTMRNLRYLNLYFQVHQPKRLKSFGFFDIGNRSTYFDDRLNEEIMKRVAKQCYLPTNLLLLKLIHRYPQIRVTFSISGVAMEQMEEFAPEVLETFHMLAATGAVEILSETYYHSLSFLAGRQEFESQIREHDEKVKTLFGVSPNVFRNTELIYSDDIGRVIHQLGDRGMLLDGAEKTIGARSPHVIYQHPDENGLNLLLRNYRLSDDIAFRFSQKSWSQWPLSAKKFIQWLENVPEKNALVNLGMDYETFGEHQKKQTGIFNFLEQVLTGIASREKFQMVTPSEAIEMLRPESTLSIPQFDRDLSAWLGNDMQQDAFDTLLKLEKPIKQINDPSLLDMWRNLQTSDHFYYMSTKKGNDGEVHTHFSPYASPYDAFMNYMNVLADFSVRVKGVAEKTKMGWNDDRVTAISEGAVEEVA
jgi:alpha-amylase